MKKSLVFAWIAAFAGIAGACSSSSDTAGSPVCVGADCTPDASSGTDAASPMDGAAPGEDAGGDSGAEHPDAGIADPTQDGPYPIAEMDGSFTSTVDGSSVPVHVAYPTGGPTAGPYPVVLFAHGFLIDESEYYGYIKRAATFGYVGITVQFPVSTFNANYPNNVTDLLGGLDWLVGQTAAPLKGLADGTMVGASGHSLGGKLSVLAAARDPRIKASITFDAVDGSANCTTPANCPDAAAALPLPIPTAFLGETLDSTNASGFSQACAPAASNYTTIYAKASSPSLQVTVLGAGHVSFVDSISACGLFCSFCSTPKAPQAQVLNLSYGYLVSFYERYLRNNMAYDTYLTGALANQLFVSTGQSTIVSK